MFVLLNMFNRTNRRGVNRTEQNRTFVNKQLRLRYHPLTTKKANLPNLGHLDTKFGKI